MRRGLILYGMVLAAIVVTAIVLVRASQDLGVGGALSRLGKGEKQFMEARERLLLGMGEPAGALVRFAAAPRRSSRARLHALRILEDLSARNRFALDRGQVRSLLRADTSAEVRAAVLRVLEKSDALDGMGDVVDLFLTARDTAVFLQSFRTLKSYVPPLEGMLASPQQHDPDSVARFLRLVDSLPVGRASLYPLAAAHYLRRGDYARAAAYDQGLGLITRWWAIGAWESVRMSGYRTVFPPETTAFSPAAVFVLPDSTQARWFRVDRLSEGPGWRYLDMMALFVRQVHCVGYLRTYVHVPDDREALLFFGSDDAAVIFVNDSVVYAHKVFRATAIDDDVVRIRLKKGANAVMAKVINDAGGWGFICRIAGPDGRPMRDARISFSDTLAEEDRAGEVARRALDAEPGWEKELAGVEPDDDALINAVTAAVADSTLDAKRLDQAMEVLTRLNARRRIPAGIGELAPLALRRLRQGTCDAVTERVLRVFADLRGSQLLVLGEAARAAASPACRFWGNLLVSLYCRDQILGLGAIDSSMDRRRGDSVLTLVEKLKPSDGWVLGRLAAWRALQGDTAGSRRIAASANMPREWVAQKFSGGGLSPGVLGRAFDEVKQAPSRDAQWAQAFEVSQHAGSGAGLVHGFRTRLVFYGGDGLVVLRTRVLSDRRFDGYISLSCPWDPVTMYVNGGLATGEPVFVTRQSGQVDPRSAGLDWWIRKVTIAKGTTELVFVAPVSWNQMGGTSDFVGMGMLDGEGRPLGFEGNAVRFVR